MHCPTCSTQLSLVGLTTDGRPGQYAARFLCVPCVGDTILGVDANTTYALRFAPTSHPYTIAPEVKA